MVGELPEDFLQWQVIFLLLCWFEEINCFLSGYSSLLEGSKANPRLPCFIDEDSPPEDGASLYEDVYYNG